MDLDLKNISQVKKSTQFCRTNDSMNEVLMLLPGPKWTIRWFAQLSSSQIHTFFMSNKCSGIWRADKIDPTWSNTVVALHLVKNTVTRKKCFRGKPPSQQVKPRLWAESQRFKENDPTSGRSSITNYHQTKSNKNIHQQQWGMVARREAGKKEGSNKTSFNLVLVRPCEIPEKEAKEINWLRTGCWRLQNLQYSGSITEYLIIYQSIVYLPIYPGPIRQLCST